MTKCPHCERTLREHERYCDFCEQDLTKIVEGKVKPKKKPKPKKQEIKRKPYYLPIKKTTIPAKEKKKIIAYCVKCKKKVTVKNPQDYIMKNKRQAINGTCSLCSCNVFRIVGMKK